MAQLHFTLDSDFFVGFFQKLRMKLLANLWKLYLIRFFRLNLLNSLEQVIMNNLKNVLIIEMELGQEHEPPVLERLNYMFQDIVMFHLKLPCSKIISVMNRL